MKNLAEDLRNAENKVTVGNFLEDIHSDILCLIFRAKPRFCVIQKIIIAVIYHAFRTKVNHHFAFNMPDNQQPRRILIAAKAFVGNIFFMKTITFFIIVFHRNCL